MAAWCAERGYEPGAVLPLERVWELARAWYGNRLDPGFRGRNAAEAAAALRGVGLDGPFWSLAGSA